jgi:hypothetical protein
VLFATRAHELGLGHHDGAPGTPAPRLEVYATYAGEDFRVGEFVAPAFPLTWTRDDPDYAAVLGLTRGPDGFTTSAPPERLTALWQARTLHRPVEGPATEDEQRGLLARVGRLLRESVPPPWDRLELDFRQAGGVTEVELRSVTARETLFWSARPPVGSLLSALRAGSCHSTRGVWLQARYTLEASGRFDFDFAFDAEPRFRRAPGRAAFRRDLAAFPRDTEHVPAWLSRLAGLPPAVRFRHARVVDGFTQGAPPVVNRRPLAPVELPQVLHYLESEPKVLTGEGLGPDIFAPAAAPVVAESYRTDGTWIWHASVPYYLRKYAIPPDPDLLAHLRAQRFHPPYVDPLVRQAAQAELLGRPRPGAAAQEPSAAEIAAEQDTVTDPPPTAVDTLTVLRRRLDEQGVWPQAYRLGEPADGAWCLRHTDRGWEVAPHRDGEPVRPHYFDHIEDAAGHLLGALLLHPARMTGGEPTPLETATELADWPITAAPGDPPLTLLRNKRMVRLGAGTELVRFGGESGNLVHRRGIRFAHTSLPLERDGDEHHYQLRRPLYVITGITVPWANLPGGAIAYVLPKTLAEHASDGSLERISESGRR